MASFEFICCGLTTPESERPTLFEFVTRLNLGFLQSSCWLNAPSVRSCSIGVIFDILTNFWYAILYDNSHDYVCFCLPVCEQDRLTTIVSKMLVRKRSSTEFGHIKHYLLWNTLTHAIKRRQPILVLEANKTIFISKFVVIIPQNHCISIHWLYLLKKANQFLHNDTRF